LAAALAALAWAVVEGWAAASAAAEPAALERLALALAALAAAALEPWAPESEQGWAVTAMAQMGSASRGSAVAASV
jgi:hypothetical protein